MKLVCEMGSTTKGDPINALAMIDSAQEAGADYVKFIMSNPDNLIADKTIEYEDEGKQYDIIKGYQMTESEWRYVINYAKNKNMPWFASVGTADYISMLMDMDCPIYKIGGWDTRNYCLFDEIIKTGKPVIFDLGAAIEGEVFQMILYFAERGSCDITLMHESHCKESRHLNLRSITRYKNLFGKLQEPLGFNLKLGYSSNDTGTTLDGVAIGLGAEFIEKRIKPNNAKGHHTNKALAPKDYIKWAAEMRMVHSALGVEELRPSLQDMAGKQKYFPSLVMGSDGKKDAIITNDMMTNKRDGRGLSSYYRYLYEGETLACDVSENQLITYDMCEDLV